jgi:hypothetical protein
MPTTTPDPIAASAILPLDTDDLRLLIDALDSHVYWQLSDREYRRDGLVHPPGADDPKTAELIVRAQALADRLRREKKIVAALAGGS